jgi:hypothetical protein
MGERKAAWWLFLALVALVGAGCSGVLLESKRPDGGLERVKIDGVESWDIYEDKPRYPQSKSKALDDLFIMLKKESTF